MKHLLQLLSVCVALLSFSNTCAQGYKKLRLNLGLGYARFESKEGRIVYFGPSYRIAENLGLRLQLEDAIAIVRYPNQTTFVNNYSLTLNGVFYLNEKHITFLPRGNVRPYIGLGAGIFKPFILDEFVNQVGFDPQIGFDYRHLTVEFDYNFSPKSSYLGVKAGFFIGGGRIPNDE